jgi:hypothetical protein
VGSRCKGRRNFISLKVLDQHKLLPLVKGDKVKLNIEIKKTTERITHKAVPRVFWLVPDDQIKCDFAIRHWDDDADEHLEDEVDDEGGDGVKDMSMMTQHLDLS